MESSRVERKGNDQDREYLGLKLSLRDLSKILMWLLLKHKIFIRLFWSNGVMTKQYHRTQQIDN